MKSFQYFFIQWNSFNDFNESFNKAKKQNKNMVNHLI